MKEIPLTQGKFAKVDDKDYKRVAKFTWYALYIKGKWYAVRWRKKREEEVGGALIYMHRFILNAPKGKQVDHRDEENIGAMAGLDNRRKNLRLASQAQNNANRRPSPHSSKYKGVCFEKGVAKWRSEINCNGVSFFLGHFDTQIKAARAYDRKACELFKEFARPNFKRGKAFLGRAAGDS